MVKSQCQACQFNVNEFSTNETCVLIFGGGNGFVSSVENSVHIKAGVERSREL